MLDYLKSIPFATRTIMFLSILIPVMPFLFPTMAKYVYFDLSFMPLQFYRLFTAIFLAPISFSLLFNLITRFQILYTIENAQLSFRSTSKCELLFFIITFSMPLLIANMLEKITTFNESINMALVKLMSALLPFDTNVSFYGFMVNSSHLPYYFFFAELAMTKLETKSYYGLVYACVYIHIRRNGFLIPQLFENGVEALENIFTNFTVRVKNIRPMRKMGQARTGRGLPSVPANNY